MRGCCWSQMLVVEMMSHPEYQAPTQDSARQESGMYDHHVTTSLSRNLVLPPDKEHRRVGLPIQPSSLVLKGEALRVYSRQQKARLLSRNDAVDDGDTVGCNHHHCKKTKNRPRSSTAVFQDSRNPTVPMPAEALKSSCSNRRCAAQHHCCCVRQPR